MHENKISCLIPKAAFEIYTGLGPGMLEAVYETLMVHELTKAGLAVKTQVALSVAYDGLILHNAYRIDMLVEGKVTVELKSVEIVLEVHHKQLLTYPHLSSHKLGPLINFKVPSIKEGIYRKVNGL